jgi:hypothetical protein
VQSGACLLTGWELGADSREDGDPAVPPGDRCGAPSRAAPSSPTAIKPGTTIRVVGLAGSNPLATYALLRTDNRDA